MSREERRKWDARWREMEEPAPPDDLLRDHADLLAGGLALDLACGRGQNALWLAAHSYAVLGVDGSRIALCGARKEALLRGLGRRALFVQADLDVWRPPANAFDLIAVFRFLDRSLFPYLRRALRPGGLLFYATRHRGVLRRRPDATPEYLLRRGELPAYFTGWEVVRHEEGPENVRFVARKPVECAHVSRETTADRAAGDS